MTDKNLIKQRIKSIELIELLGGGTLMDAAYNFIDLYDELMKDGKWTHVSYKLDMNYNEIDLYGYRVESSEEFEARTREIQHAHDLEYAQYLILKEKFENN